MGLQNFYNRNVTNHLYWLDSKTPRLAYFFMSMLTLAFVPMLLVMKFQILGADMNAFSYFIETGYSEYLGLASLLLLLGSLAGYFASSSWLFFKKATEGAF